MNKLDQLRKELEKARKKLNDRGISFSGDANNYEEIMKAKPFEIAYQDVIEKIWPDNAWWEITKYWDIFDAMMGGLSDEAVIDEIIKHVDSEFLNEAKEDTINGVKVEYGHNIKEYMDKFGDAYDDGMLWDFSKEDFESNAIEPQNIVYWYMQDLDGEWRYFETNIANECIKEEKELKEGTSNFGRLEHFPLLVFYTIDEFYDMMRYDSGYPKEEDFETDLGNGDYHIDYDAYEEARDNFEQKFWDENEVCVLDEDDVERLEDMLYDFNKESENMAYDADVNEDGYQEYGPNLNLEDVKLKVEPGYYAAAYIDVEHEDYLDDLEDDFREQQMLRFNGFFDQLRKEFGLTKLGVAWGPASNGETGYKILNDSLKENKEEVKEDAHQEELDLPKEVTIDISTLVDDDIDLSGNDYNLDEVISDWLSDNYGFCHFGFNYEYDYNKDPDFVHVYDIDWDTSDEEMERTELENLEEKKSKKKYKINFTGDPAKNAAFFNHAMGSDKGDGGLQQGGVSLGEDAKRHYYEAETGVILEPEDKEYDSYKMDGLYGGKLSFYDESQFAFPEDELDKWKENCKKYVDEGVNNTYAIIKGPFELDDDINVEDIKEFDYDIGNVIWSYRKDKDGNIEENFIFNSIKDNSESLEEDTSDLEHVARVEYCVMDKNNNNIECFDNTDDAIAFAKDNEGIRVLEVQYGPKDENGDEPELSAEEVWSIRESLKESMKSEVTKWWNDVEDANIDMKWGFKIDNGDYDDVEGMHAAMFDMLNELKEKGASELFKQGKKIYNKYAKYSKYNDGGLLTPYDKDESLKEDVNAKRCKEILNKWIDWNEVDETGDVDFARNQLRSLHSEKAISDDEYDYITQHWDELLNTNSKEDSKDSSSQDKKFYKRIYIIDKDNNVEADTDINDEDDKFYRRVIGGKSVYNIPKKYVNSGKPYRGQLFFDDETLFNKSKTESLEEGHVTNEYKGYELDWNDDSLDVENADVDFTVVIKKDGKEVATAKGFKEARKWIDDNDKNDSIYLDKYTLEDDASEEQKEDVKIMPFGNVTKSQWEEFLSKAKWEYWLDWEQLKNEVENKDESLKEDVDDDYYDSTYDNKEVALLKQIAQSLHMPYTDDDPASYDEWNYISLLHDYNNGRGEEWVDVFEGQNLNKELLDAYKKLVHYEEDEEDESLKESIDFEEMKRLLEGLENFLREEDVYYELWFDTNNDTINAEIEWGDWKHDHLWFDHVATQYLKGQGYDVDVDVEVTDEDGSDTYSAIHSLKIRKKSKFDEGANYSKYAYYEYPKDSGCHVRETPTCFVAINKYGSSVGESQTKAGAEGILDDYLNNLNKVREGLDDGKAYFWVKYWEDEERRDQGESDIYMDDFETKEEAINLARKLVDRMGFASVEVFYSPDGDVNENDDELVWGYDGVDVWGPDKDESLDEASSAEKKAFKHGGDDYADYVDGKAIARIKDKDERVRAIANKKLAKKGKLGDRAPVDKEYERKVQQADDAFQKKQKKMQDAGTKED